MATVYIPNSSIQTKVENEEDKVKIRQEEKKSEYLVMIAPEIYSPYVVIEKGKKFYIVKHKTKFMGHLNKHCYFIESG